MRWQDWVLTLGQVIFIIALIPTILNKQKPALLTSITSAVVLIFIAAVYISFTLWFAALTTILTSIMWFVLALQSLGIISKEKLGWKKS